MLRLRLLLLVLVSTTTGAAALAACPGSNFTVHFTVTRRGPGRPRFDRAGIQSFFEQTLPADLGIFKTRTTTVDDVCSVATLAVSDRTAGAASTKAIRVNNQKKNKRQTRSAGTAVYAVVAANGAPDLQAIHIHDLEANVERALGGSVRVGASIQEGELTMQGLRDRAMGIGAAPSLPPRTHTFSPYASSATFKGYLPVVVATPDYSGELPLDLVAVADGRQLRASLCAVSKVYRSPRKQNTWAELSRLESRAFTVRSTATGVRLNLNLGQSTFFLKLRGQVDLGKNGQGAVKDFLGNLLGRKVLGKRQAQIAGIRSSNNSNEMASTQNYATADYAHDYAVLFDCGATKNLRVDLTLVPRINRGGMTAPGTALVCQPGSATQGLQFMQNDAPALSASSGACPAFPRRPSPSRILDNATFEGLHPEERDWVAARLAKTRVRMANFIQQNLPPSPTPTPPVTVDGGRAELRLAVAVSGGGKRSLFNAAGVLSGLSRAGVLDLATWTAGASGGAWLLGGVYSKSVGQTALVDPATYVSTKMTDIARSVFDGTFRANEAITNFGTTGMTLPVAPFAPSSATAAATTDKIFCQSELKFQSPAVPASQTGSPALAEYWARALGYQLLTAPEGGSGLTFSGLARDSLLAAHNAPLPVIQLHQQEDLGNPNKYWLWEVSPFDVSVHQGGLHVSYPTELFGTDPADASKRCVTNADQLSTFLGISSWMFPAANAIAGGTLKTIVCGEAGSACQPVRLNNPFLGHTGPSKQAPGADLFTSKRVSLLDGATQWNNPVFSFVTPTRRADVAIVIDSSGWTDAPPLSTDPAGTCSADAASCGSQTYYTGTPPGSKCCDTCSPLLDFSCWPTASPADNDLFSLPRFSPEHTLPAAWPSTSTDAARLQRMITEITFFGCHEPNKTAIVYVPNRAVSSSKSGFIALRNAVELNEAYGLGAEPLGSSDLNDIVENGQDQVGAPALKGCLACLFHASLRDQNRATYWQSNPRCSACFNRYCFTG